MEMGREAGSFHFEKQWQERGINVSHNTDHSVETSEGRQLSMCASERNGNAFHHWILDLSNKFDCIKISMAVQETTQAKAKLRYEKNYPTNTDNKMQPK